MATRNEVLSEQLKGWLAAKGDRKRRKEITDLVCSSVKMHPKSVSRAFRRIQMRDPSSVGRGGRPVSYGSDVTAALFDAWEAGDRCCGELLHPMIPEYVSVMRRDSDWKHGEEATSLLVAMSERTMKRRVTALSRKHGGYGRGKSSTRPSTLKPTIPIFKGPWKDLPPGHGQVDTVAHCGDTLRGDFVFSVNYTDAATYWVVFRAQWNKGQRATLDSLIFIRDILPFPLLSLHPDSGGEFINWLAKGWCDREGIGLSRSEPGRKNDNMFVEERNGHAIRRYVGYVRYDVEETVAGLNELYETLCAYLNHFKAVRRCILKERVGAKYVRRYEATAKTPYQRALEHPAVSDDAKAKLRAEHEKLNPLRLKRRIDTLIQKVYKQQKAARNDRAA